MCANVFTVDHSAEIGRHLTAACNISPGTVVVCQDPFASILYGDQCNVRCDCCFKLSDSLTRCSRCKVCRYIDRNHQLKGWSKGHKQECSALLAARNQVPPPTLRLAARVFWRKQREGGSSEVSDPAALEYANILQLESHWDNLSDDRKITYAQMATIVRQFMIKGGSDESQAPPLKDIAQLLSRFSCNNHTVCDEEMRPIGIGIFPLAALVNHSCTPNCTQSFQDDRIQFRAIRPIAAGEEITISYIELAAPCWERRTALMEQYFFDVLQQVPQRHESHPSSRQVYVSGGVGKWYDCDMPPWEYQEKDVKLTALAVTQGGGQVQLCVSGGMWGRVNDTASNAFLTTTRSTLDEHLLDELSADAAEERDIDDELVETAGRVAAAHGAGTGAQERAGPSGDGAVLEVHGWAELRMAGCGRCCDVVASVSNFARVLRLLHDVEQLLTGIQAEQAVRTLLHALSLADGDVDQGVAGLGPLHQLRMNVNAALLRAANMCGQWEVALRAANSLTDTYTLLYPQVWPTLGLHHAMVAKLSALMGQAAAAATAAHKSLECLKYTHPDGVVLREVEGILYDACREMEQEDD